MCPLAWIFKKQPTRWLHDSQKNPLMSNAISSEVYKTSFIILYTYRYTRFLCQFKKKKMFLNFIKCIFFYHIFNTYISSRLFFFLDFKLWISEKRRVITDRFKLQVFKLFYLFFVVECEKLKTDDTVYKK